MTWLSKTEFEAPKNLAAHASAGAITWIEAPEKLAAHASAGAIIWV